MKNRSANSIVPGRNYFLIHFIFLFLLFQPASAQDSPNGLGFIPASIEEIDVAFRVVKKWHPEDQMDVLELAGTLAFYRPDTSIKDQNEEETADAVNWFFNGHRNKLTAELTYFDFTVRRLQNMVCGSGCSGIFFSEKKADGRN